MIYVDSYREQNFSGNFSFILISSYIYDDESIFFMFKCIKNVFHVYIGLVRFNTFKNVFDGSSGVSTLHLNTNHLNFIFLLKHLLPPEIPGMFLIYLFAICLHWKPHWTVELYGNRNFVSFVHWCSSWLLGSTVSHYLLNK